MTKRLTVVYEVPDNYNVTRITGTGELVVVRCEWMDALAQLAAAEKDRDEAQAEFVTATLDVLKAREAARFFYDVTRGEISETKANKVYWLERWPWLKEVEENDQVE